MKQFRVYASLPVARDLRDPEIAKKLSEKARCDWVWLAFQSRRKRDEIETRPIG